MRPHKSRYKLRYRILSSGTDVERRFSSYLLAFILRFCSVVQGRTPRSITLHFVSWPRIEEARWSDLRLFQPISCLSLFFLPFPFFVQQRDDHRNPLPSRIFGTNRFDRHDFATIVNVFRWKTMSHTWSNIEAATRLYCEERNRLMHRLQNSY